MTTATNAKTIFANNLIFHLKMNNKKKADLARYLGCSTGLVSAWCAGQKMPRVNTVNEICIWLHIEMADLLEDKTGKENVYEKRDAERIANILIENRDMHDLFYICEKMSPEKIKALLTLFRENT